MENLFNIEMVSDGKMNTAVALQNLTLDLNNNLKQFVTSMENLFLHFKNGKEKSLDLRKVNVLDSYLYFLIF